MLDTDMSVPRVVGKQNEAATALEYYRSNYTVQFVDHLLSEFNGRFSDENQVGKLFKILPSCFHSQHEQGLMDFEEIECELLFWESYLPHPASLKITQDVKEP